MLRLQGGLFFNTFFIMMKGDLKKYLFLSFKRVYNKQEWIYQLILCKRVRQGESDGFPCMMKGGWNWQSWSSK
ncbi:hypothetical protein IJ22_20330 [Paenibacillus naphthalenovorans]|uniref:Uncharacterized protein n=1 Tax=Paenibacillus naphthalenovorans TaxID=162209 RepID=A0A0U2VSB9_9BACL|nr:hypothetical protein IJ22_20330 [Paenibacillus naphthalenovorans]